MITIRSVESDEHAQLIDIDQKALFTESNIPLEQAPPLLSREMLQQAVLNHDKLYWIYFDQALAGYCWFQLKLDALYIAGIGILRAFYGLGLCAFITDLAGVMAKEFRKDKCTLAVDPLNGRAVKAYLKQGFYITHAIPAFLGKQYPRTFRFLMEKSLIQPLRFTPDKILDSREIEVCKNLELEKTTQEGYYGVKLRRSESGNNFNNIVIFVKLSCQKV